MKNKGSKTLPLIFLVILLLPVLLMQPVSVLAAEEEEEDNFTVMPNYRWTNESTTDSAVQEFVSGSQYEVYNQNNGTSGTQKFEKSRDLNSRDFYYESRFQLDIGGNETEYFRDVKGDACDFEEDLEGVVAGSDGFSDGIWYKENPVLWDLVFELYLDPVINLALYKSIDMRIKIVSDYTGYKSIIWYLRSGLNGLEGYNGLGITELTSDWQDISLDVTILREIITYDFQSESVYKIYGYGYTGCDESETDMLYMDDLKIIGALDYATHVEGEVEDTWDWEDSLEYFYDSLDNVSDFNDGTTEDWVAGIYTDPVTVSDGWLKVNTDGSSELVDIEYNSTLIDTSIYKHFCMEVWSDNTSGYGINSVVFYDNDSNALFTWNDDIAVDSYGLVYGEFDGDWTGTEIELRIRFNFLGTHADNRLSVNFTYLYDYELGDLEEYTGLDYQYVNPEGHLSGKMGAGLSYEALVTSNTQNIDVNNFELMKLRIRGSTDLRIYLRCYDIDANSYYLHETSPAFNFQLTEEFTTYEFNLSTDSDWLSIPVDVKQFVFVFDDLFGDGGNLEGDERIDIDYILLTGHYSETDGFKFSLLNQNHEEGMYWQFTREGTTDEYTVHVDMLDVSGIALSYEQEFNYSRSTDGWLFIDVEWHLDKKTIKFNLEYENGTDIVKTRSFTDIYATSGTGQFLLLEEGMPTLCMNNSMGAMARSLVLIDYIDADWQLNTWVQPDNNYTDWVDHQPWIAGNSDQFTQTGIFGASSIDDDMGDYDAFYRLDIDRFDAVSFDFSQTVENLEYLDVTYFNFELVNVLPNGSLYGVAHLSSGMYYNAANWHQWAAFINDEGTNVEDYHGDVETNYVEGSISCYRNPDSSVVFDYNIENANHTVQGSMNCPVTYSKEFLVFFNYRIDTADGADANDIIRIKVSSFDVIRKDIFTGVIASITDPILGGLAIIFSPFLAILNLITGVIRGGFKFVVDLLSPLLLTITSAIGTLTTAIGAIAGDVGTAVWGSMGGALNFITDAIGSIANDVWNNVGGALNFITDAIAEIASDIWDSMGDALDWIVTDIIALIGTTLTDWMDIIVAWLVGVGEDFADFVFDVLGFLLTLIGDIIGDIVEFIIYGIFFFWDLLGLPDLIAVYDSVIVGLMQLVTSVPAMIVWVLGVWFWWATGIFFIGFLIFFVYPIISSSDSGDFFGTFIDINGKDCTLGVALLGFSMHIPVGLVFWPCFFLMFIMEAL